MLHPFLGPPALLLLVAAIALGGVPLEVAIDRSRRPVASDAERAGLEPWLVRFALGSASWMVILFAAASLQLLRASVVLPLLATLALSGALLLARRRRESRPAPLDERSAGDANAASAGGGRVAPAILCTSLAVVLAGLWLHALRPDLATDADVYHLTLPRLYLEHGGFYRVPWSVYSNWPLGAELLYAAAMATADHALANGLHFAFGVLALAGTALLASSDPPVRKAGGASALLAAALAAALALANPVVLFEIRVAYVDLAQAFYLVLGALVLERWHAGALSARPALLVCGICCGAMASLKPNGFFGAVPLVGLYLWLELRRRRRDRPATGDAPRAARGMLLLAAPAVLLAAPWVLKALVLTGNPVYPFLYEQFGGPDWTAELGDRFVRWQRSIGMGREPVDYLLLPLRAILLGDFGYARFDGRITPAWIALLALAAFGARRDGRSRRLLVMAGVFFVLWAATSQQMRFLIPILPLLAAATSRGALVALGALAARARVLAATLGATTIAVLLFAHAAVYLRQAPRLLRDFAVHGAALHDLVRHPVYAWMDRELPADAKLLLLGTNRGFFVPRSFLADSFFEASQVEATFRSARDAAEAARRLRRLGVTHVLLDRRGVRVALPRALVEAITSGEHARRVHATPDGRFEVYAVAPGPT